MPVRRKAPTSQDVARLAGVSQSTVSYVLTGSRPISEATRARVEDAIAKLGYHPNSGARTLRSRRSGVIGLMVPEADADDGVLMTFVGTIAREARRFGYDILLVTAQEADRPLVGADHAQQGLQGSGLPCPILPDQAHDLPLGHGQINMIQGKILVVLAQSLYFNQVLHGSLLSFQ